LAQVLFLLGVRRPVMVAAAVAEEVPNAAAVETDYRDVMHGGLEPVHQAGRVAC